MAIADKYLDIFGSINKEVRVCLLLQHNIRRAEQRLEG